jgi:hypothetical protein
MMAEGLWGLKPLQFLADLLALSQPALPDFQTLRRPWMVKATLSKTAAAAAIAIARLMNRYRTLFPYKPDPMPNFLSHI